MSNPPNPLSKYRTYSYQHVLAVCDSTLTANQISDNGTLSEYFLNRPSEDRLKTETTVSGGKYVVLISGFTDAQFVIQDIRWSTIIASDTPSADGNALPSTIEVDGEMSILEPTGVRFMNVLSNVCDSLMTDPVGLVFVLKTFFVGHTDDEHPDVISNVRPFLFIPYDIQAKFDEAGATYSLGFVGLSNGVGKLPYVNEIAGALTVAPAADGKVGQTLEHVFTTFMDQVIKTEYAANRKRLEEDFKKAGLVFDFNTDFRPVTYKFDLDPQYRGYTFGTNEIVQIENKPNSPILAFSSAPTMEMIINAIMMSSKEVVAECNDKENKYIFKITSSLESTPTEYVVTYHIHRYKMVTVAVDNTKDKPFVPDPGNLIEFDYVFSGKNIDIIDFDIKMELGLAFFQTIATSQNLTGQTESPTTAQRDVNGNSGAIAGTQARSSTASPVLRKGTPLFLGGAVTNALYRNKTNPVDTGNFQAMVARHAAIENIQCKMTIAGNPQLLDEMSATPEDFRNRQTETPKEGQTIAPKWMTVPAYVKVNIFMPSNTPGNDYVDRFWYDGYYQILSVDNIFSNGEFIQEIEMFSLPFGSNLDARSDETASVIETVTVTASRLPPAEQENNPPTISSRNQSILDRKRTLRATKQ